jgi:hypothetical protein
MKGNVFGELPLLLQKWYVCFSFRFGFEWQTSKMDILGWRFAGCGVSKFQSHIHQVMQ